jgi:hypothetical protein
VSDSHNDPNEEVDMEPFRNSNGRTFGGRGIALMVAGILAGSILITPAVAGLPGSFPKLANRLDRQFVSETEAAQFLAADVIVVRTPGSTNTIQGIKRSSATCPSDRVLLGGGGQILGDVGVVHLTASHPSELHSDVWEVTGASIDNARPPEHGWTVVAYAVCALR